jgi:hypothetical protein
MIIIVTNLEYFFNYFIFFIFLPKIKKLIAKIQMDI